MVMPKNLHYTTLSDTLVELHQLHQVCSPGEGKKKIKEFNVIKNWEAGL